jgi:hypothetical protein
MLKLVNPVTDNKLPQTLLIPLRRRLYYNGIIRYAFKISITSGILLDSLMSKLDENSRLMVNELKK